jgi:hypothetical protein
MAIQINQLPLNNNILDTQEQELVASKDMTRLFGLPEDFIQFFVYSNTNTLLNTNNNFQEYSVTDNQLITFDPEKNISDLGYRVGTYNLYYNFLRPILTLNSNSDLFIQSISQDRLEIKISSTIESDSVLYSNAISYIDLIQNRNYFIEFYIDLGNNNLIAASSLAIEQDINGAVYIIIKLFDALPSNISLNYPINVVEKIVNSQLYQAILTIDTILSPTVPTLRQANFSIEVDDKRIGSSDYYSFDQITNNSGSNLILNYISQSLPEININYTNYNNFIHFGSATQRLETFKNKLSTLESYQSYINSIPSTNLDYITYQNKINNILQNFDGYESYLYYQSNSYAWPKSNTNKPYILYPVTSSQAITWYNFQYTSASYYDEFNNNNLIYGLPLYIQEKDDFQYVKPFVQSIGQTFDDIWIYIKAFTDLWKAKNKLTEGISKDLVGLALQSLGISLYTDGDQDDLNLWLNGINNEGNYTFQTSSFQTAITASEYTLSGQDEAKTVFKRLYHNLPTLLKSKGSNKFANYLNTLYGVPETILYPIEFGGVDKNSDNSEFNYDKFTYGLKYGSEKYSYIYKPNVGIENYGFKTLEFRFNPITGSGKQILIAGVTGSGGGNVKWGVTVEPTSLLGYNYGIIKLINYDTGSSTYISSSLTLPIYVTSSDKTYGWWDVSITENSTNQYTLNVQNKIDNLVGHQTSSILTTVSPLDNKEYYISVGNINPSGGITIPSQFGNGTCYSQIQEIRGWSEILNTFSLNTHTLNPESYIGNSESSSYDNLLWKFPLGNNLDTYNHSVIINLTGSQPKENINNYLIFSGSWSTNDYISFVETYYSIPAVGGYSTPVTDKIRIVTQNTSSNILHPQKSIIYLNQNNVRTTDIHLTQTGFSPQDQINNDIIAQLGDTYNLDDIIGNPLNAGTYSYSELEKLRDQYFKKYNNKYNYKDFTQLIETFHKSLFRYITESIPGRSEEATGIVIKPHILERSKVKRYEPTIDTSSYEATIYIGSITGSNPGGYCCSRNSPFNEAFINGNFSGSEILMDSYYNQDNPFLKYPVTVNTKSFNEQYGGWDALNNNVSSAILSRYKQKEVKQPSYRNPNNICGTCGEWDIIIGNTGSSELSPGYSYIDCSTGNINTVNTLQNISVRVESCTQPTALIPASASISFIGYNKPQFLISASFFTDFEFDDSLLTNTSYITSRESGVKTISPDFNLPILTGSIPTTESLSNIDKLTSFMAFSDWAGNSLAGKFGTSNFHIKWLIDENGDVYKPQNSSSYYWNTDQAFGAGLPVNISIYSGDGNISGDYETIVHMPLKQYNTILYSDTGSLGTNYLVNGFYTTMSFDVVENIYNNPYDLNITGGSTGSFTGGSEFIIPLNNIILDRDNGFNIVTSIYTVQNTSAVKASFTAFATLVNDSVTSANLRLAVYKNTTGNIIETIGIKTQTSVVGGGSALITVTGSVYLNAGEQLYLEGRGTQTWSILDSQFTLDPILTVPGVTSPYWTTGSATSTSLTSSLALGSAYGYYNQIPVSNSGFPTPLPFTLQQYDQIRFEGNENKIYTIMSVNNDGTNVYITLDKPIPANSTNVNYFSIRRLVDDAGFIMIDNNPQQQTGRAPSFIIPKYPSPSLKKNLNNIIQNLYQKNLL